MSDFFENLRNKPIAVRKKILFYTMFVFGVFIISGWLSILDTRVSDLNKRKEDKISEKYNEFSPFSAVANSAIDMKDGLSSVYVAVSEYVKK